MDYNKIFDISYSTSIPESLKNKILFELLEVPVLESAEQVNPLVENYIQLLDTLIFSTVSEDKMNSVIDEVFSTLDEEFINEVSAEFIKQKAQNSLINRQRAFDNATQDYRAAKTGLKDSNKEFKAAKNNMKDGPIGLTSFKHYDDAQKKHEQAQTVHDTAKSNLDKATSRIDRAKALASGNISKQAKATTEAPKATSNIGSETKANTETTNQTKTSPMDKLKSAAGKVKDWWNKNTKMNTTHDQVGLVHAIGKKAIENEKAGKEDIGFSTINKNTEETPSTETSANETPSAKPKRTSTRGGGRKKKTEATPETPASTETTAETPASTEVKNTAEVENEAKPEGDKQKINTTGTKGRGRKKKTEATPETPASTEATSETPSAETTPKKGRGRKKTETPTSTETTETSATSGLSAAEKRELARQNQGYRKALDAKRERLNSIRSRSVQTDDDKEQSAALEKEIAELEKKLGSNAALKEALTELATLLIHTNISEGLFVDIMELAAPTQARVKKIENKYEKALGAAMDDLYKDVEARKPESPEKIKKVEEIGNRLNNLKRRRKLHFNS